MLNGRVVNIAFVILSLVWIAGYYVYNISVTGLLVLATLYFSILAYGSFKLSAEFFLPVRFKGKSDTPSIALTFDDGPVEGKTEKILDILRMHNVKAAFFCIGNRVKSNPEIVKRIYSEGHVLGNHSYWHGKTFDLQSSQRIAEELVQTDSSI